MSLPRSPADFRGPFRTDPLTTALYAESAGILYQRPAGVALPRDVADLQRLVRWAAAHEVPLTPRGSGSSMSGGAVGPGVVVDLHAFGAEPVVQLAWDRLTSGVACTHATVDAAAHRAGLRFPVDPSSSAFATVGGMVACNAAGARTLAFGDTRRWVQAVSCVFADGTRARVARGEVPSPDTPPVLQRWFAARDDLQAAARLLPRPATRKDSSAYGFSAFADSGDLVDLLVGSEGTLALFTDLDLALAPLPAARATVYGAWASIEAAVHGAALAREARAVACELLDRTFLEFAARAHPLPAGDASGHVLLVELEGDSVDGVAARARALADAWSRARATGVLLGLDDRAAAALWSLRHAASPILARLDPHLRSMQIIEDGCVPPAALAAYVRGIHALLDEVGVQGVLFGHAGDAHLHVNALIDLRHPAWRDQVRALFSGGVALVRSLGGTLAGEHGDGRLRTPALGAVRPPAELALLRRVKALFDPAGILNPGVKTGDGGDPFGAIRYDPARHDDPRVRALLDEVERTRRYDRCRLTLADTSL